MVKVQLATITAANKWILVYFADDYVTQQRGSNESINREFFPKKTDLQK